MFFTIECENNQELEIESVTKILSENCSLVKLRRYDTSKSNFEAIFLIQLKEISSLSIIKTQINTLNNEAIISFLDQDANLV